MRVIYLPKSLKDIFPCLKGLMKSEMKSSKRTRNWYLTSLEVKKG